MYVRAQGFQSAIKALLSIFISQICLEPIVLVAIATGFLHIIATWELISWL